MFSRIEKGNNSNALIIKILLILQIYGISYRSAESFFRNHPDIKNVLGVKEIPNFRTLSRRARMIDWHKINNEILQSWMSRSYRYSSRNRWTWWDHNEALEILRERYARGEITKEQYDKMREDLEK